MRLINLFLIGLLFYEISIAQNMHGNSNAGYLEYAVGADVPFLLDAEANGVEFKENGKVRAGLDILNDHGYDWVRLRLFHTPTDLPNDLEYTIKLAQEAKKRGMKFLLDYHYADSWADPQKQPLPKAWEGLSYEILKDSVYEYTKRTIIAFRQAGVMPEMVQIGYEIRNGMMWPIGKLPEGWDDLSGLIIAGINGVDAGRGQEQRPRIMIHYDNGADAIVTKNFFKKIESYGIQYDIIGLSYYPWWHRSLIGFRENLISLIDDFNQDIILVETAYNWTPIEYLNNGDIPPFEESPVGQKEFLEAVNRTLLAIPSTKIKGVFWWEPAVTGSIRSRGYFDDDGNVLPVINVFDSYKQF